MFESEEIGISLEYPEYLYVREYPNDIEFAYEPFTDSMPGPHERFEFVVDDYTRFFESLSSAEPGQEVPEAANAVDTKVFKISNIKIGQYDAVEYIRDGINYKESELGRGYIGYEHKVLINLNNNKYLMITNTTETKQKTETRDVTFNRIIESLKFK